MSNCSSEENDVLSGASKYVTTSSYRNFPGANIIQQTKVFFIYCLHFWCHIKNFLLENCWRRITRRIQLADEFLKGGLPNEIKTGRISSFDNHFLEWWLVRHLSRDLLRLLQKLHLACLLLGRTRLQGVLVLLNRIVFPLVSRLQKPSDQPVKPYIARISSKLRACGYLGWKSRFCIRFQSS